MSRSGYSCDLDYSTLNLWRGAVESAIKGRRGQKLLCDLREALDAMPVKELIAEELIASDGQCCALGALAKARQLSVENVDPEDPERVAKIFNIAPSLAQEIAFENDERATGRWSRADETKAERWTRMRQWVDSQIKKEPNGNN